MLCANSVYDPEQWEERVVVAGSLVKVQVVEHGTGLVELDESLEAVDAALQGERVWQLWGATRHLHGTSLRRRG